MNQLHESLRDNVRELGDYLGQTISHHLGDDFLEKIEEGYTIEEKGSKLLGVLIEAKVLLS